MAFYQRIRDLREDADKTQTDIAEYLGTTAQYYGKYEKGERELPFSRAIALAQYYGVSLDYLAGLTNCKNGMAYDRDEMELLSKWNYLTERNKGKVEYLIAELMEAQAEKREALS